MIAMGNQMNLGQIIDLLDGHEIEKKVWFDFANFAPYGPRSGVLRSYRGHYEDLAIGYEAYAECRLGDLVAELKDAVGKVFTGYKGGYYRMERDTTVWVARYNESGGTGIVGIAHSDDYRVILHTEMIDP